MQNYALKTPAENSLVGVGLRPKHYDHLLTKPGTKVGWFEALTENYMDSAGRPRQVLETIRQDFPVAVHGVSMSIGSVDGVDSEYLNRLKEFIANVEPFIVSDHLCFTRCNAHNMHDLLPMPLTDEALDILCNNVDQVQTTLGRQLVLENVSSYLTYKADNKSEWQFLNELINRTGAGILLDINNIYVSSFNHNYSAEEFIDTIDASAVQQMHLAGFSDMGNFYFDTHSAPVHENVWPLFERAIGRMPNVPVLIEWDEDIPEFSVLEDEAAKAAAIIESAKSLR